MNTRTRTLVLNEPRSVQSSPSTSLGPGFRSLIVTLVWLVLLAGISTGAFALEQASEEEQSSEAARDTDSTGDTQEEFFLSTTITATLNEVDVFDIPMSVSVIDDLEDRPVNNAADLLLTEPGVDVNGAGANQSRPIIRGQRGLRVLFLEDGLSLNNPRRQSDFGEITGLIDLEQMGRVEVVRGPSSVLYGSGAIGGVLNVIPLEAAIVGPGSSTRFNLAARSSSADSQTKFSGGLAGHFNNLAYQLHVSTRDAEAWEAPSGSFGNVTLREDTTVFDTGVKDDNQALDLKYQVSDHQSLRVRSTRYSAGEFGFGFVDPALIEPDFNGTQTRIFYPFQDFDRTVLGWSGVGFERGALSTFDVRAYTQSNERELVFDAGINIGPVFPGAPNSSIEIDTLNFTDIDTDGLRLEASKGFGNSLLTFGVDWSEDDLLNTDTSTTSQTFRFAFPPSVIGVIPGFTCIDFRPPFECNFESTDDVANTPNSTNKTLGLFVQEEFRPTDNFTAIAGIRYQEVETTANATPGLDTTGLDFEDDQVVGSLNLLYRLSEQFELVGSFGTAFRAPSIVERLFNGITPEGSGFQLLNPALESETSEYFDLGFKYRRGNAYFDAVYFRNDIDDGIIQDFFSPAEIAALPAEIRQIISSGGVSFVVQQRNIDRTVIEGVELSAAYRLPIGLTLGGNYTHLDSERRDSLNPPTGDTPSDKLNFFARYERGRYRAEYRLRSNGSERTVLEPGDPVPVIGERLPSFTVHGLSGFVAFEGNSRLSHRIGLSIENLTDELYAEFSNIGSFRPSPKRNFVLSYRLGLR